MSCRAQHVTGLICINARDSPHLPLELVYRVEWSLPASKVTEIAESERQDHRCFADVVLRPSPLRYLAVAGVARGAMRSHLVLEQATSLEQHSGAEVRGCSPSLHDVLLVDHEVVALVPESLSRQRARESSAHGLLRWELVTRSAARLCVVCEGFLSLGTK